MVGAELSSLLVRSRECDQAGDIEGAESVGTSLLRVGASDPAAASSFMSLDMAPSPSMAALLRTLSSLRTTARQRLSTTVEEENRTNEYFNDVQTREEKAGKECLSLQQQLGAERRERARQSAAMAEAEARARAELDGVETHAALTARALAAQKSQQVEAEAEAFNTEEGNLVREAARLLEELSEVQQSNREAESKLRKRKTKAEDEVVQWLAEYDKDMGAKEAVLVEERMVYDRVVRQLREYDEHYAQLRAEAEAREAGELAEEIERKEREAHEIRLDRAAATIQNVWRAYKKSIAPKKEKKGKGKGKGKGKKGKKGKK